VFETPRTRTFLPVAAAAESFLHGTVGSRAARCGVLLLHGARCMRSLPKKFEARAVRFQIFVLRCETFAWRAFFLLARTTTRFHRCETFGLPVCAICLKARNVAFLLSFTLPLSGVLLSFCFHLSNEMADPTNAAFDLNVRIEEGDGNAGIVPIVTQFGFSFYDVRKLQISHFVVSLSLGFDLNLPLDEFGAVDLGYVANVAGNALGLFFLSLCSRLSR